MTFTSVSWPAETRADLVASYSSCAQVRMQYLGGKYNAYYADSWLY
jgi:hypothetical protein